MSEAEFDSYLSLLSKFLRLRARQRGDLADELRDHLDSRLEELLAAGKTREEAVAVALEEFGDAAVLATEFSRLASRRTRRFVMRCTAASAAVVAAVILVSVALAPPGPNGPGPDFVAAQPGAEGGGGPPAELPGTAGVPATPDKASVEQQAVAALDEKLGKVVGAEYEQVALRDALTYVADSIDADLILDETGLTEAGVSIDDPITLKLTRTAVSARTVLDFILDPYNLTFVNRSGVLFVTTTELAEELHVTKVYNVRDLLENAQAHDYGAGMMGGDGRTGGGRGGMGGMGGGMGGMMPAGGMGGGLPAKPIYPGGPVGDLMSTIVETTSGPWFDVDDIGGTMTVFNGLLVVRQTEQVHGEIQKLLEALREAGRQQPGGTVTVPKAGEAPAAPAAGLPPGMAGPAPTDYPGGGQPGPPTVPAPQGLGERFADYRPTPQMRKMFLRAFGTTGVGPGEIGEVGLFQILLQNSGPAMAVFQDAGIDTEQVQEAFNPTRIDRPIGDLYAFLDSAQSVAKQEGLETIDTGHLLAVLLDKGHDGPLRDVLARMGIGIEEVKRWLNEHRKSTPPEQRNPLQTVPANSDEKHGEGQATFYEPSGEEVNWPELGLQMTAVKNPQWFAGNDRTHKWAAIGLRVDHAPANGRAGLRAGDVIVSYSADQWTRNPQDPETIAFSGREIPFPERITRQVALAHGTTAIAFQVIRIENGLPRPVSVRVPIAEPANEGDRPPK